MFMCASRAASSSISYRSAGIAPTNESAGIQLAPLAKTGTPLSTKRKKRVPGSAVSTDWSRVMVRMPARPCHVSTTASPARRSTSSV